MNTQTSLVPIPEKKTNSSLRIVEKLSRSPKIIRFLYHPYRYLFALVHRKLLYPISKNAITVTADLFFKQKILVKLPAGTDLYLTGGKTHDSEIRLAKYLLHELNENSYFLDIGAHFGYFSLLAYQCRSQVLAIEASVNTYSLLVQNINDRFQCLNLALSQESGKITFYEFEQLYSEYNTTQIEQYKYEVWMQNAKVNEIHIIATTIDQLIKEQSFTPTHIKIDVEGHEFPVILGAIQCLSEIKPILIMEYLSHKNSENYRQAHQFLLENGYHSYIINTIGELNSIEDIETYLHHHQLTSDNIIYKI